MKKLSLHKVTA